MTITATFVRDLDDFTGTAKLWKLSEPVEYGWTNDAAQPLTEYVVTSATNAYMTGPETYIFPSDEQGEVTEWGEMAGSYRGGLSHSTAIANAGWDEVVEANA